MKIEKVSTSTSMVRHHKANGADMVVNQSRGSSASRHDLLRSERTGNVEIRNMMAIQNLLNPMDNDRNRMDSWSPPSESASESTLFTPVSSPQSTGSLDTAATAGSAESEMNDALLTIEDIALPPQASDSPVRVNAARPQYTPEQAMWIWFFFIDARKKWDEIVEIFKADWPGEDRGKTGMQCKAYRLCEKYGLPKKRMQNEGPENPALYGMWANTRRSYRWMDEYAGDLPGYVPGGPYYSETGQ